MYVVLVSTEEEEAEFEKDRQALKAAYEVIDTNKKKGKVTSTQILKAVANPMSKFNKLLKVRKNINMTAGSLKTNFAKAKFIGQQGYITEIQFVNIFMPDGEKLFEEAHAVGDSATKAIDHNIKKRLSTTPVNDKAKNSIGKNKEDNKKKEVKKNTFTKAENKEFDADLVILQECYAIVDKKKVGHITSKQVLKSLKVKTFMKKVKTRPRLKKLFTKGGLTTAFKNATKVTKNQFINMFMPDGRKVVQ